MFATTAVMGSLVMLASCEWTGSSGDNSFNSAAFSWVNFSGVYRATGSFLVSSFSTSGGGTAGSTNIVSNEGLGSGNGVKTTFSGVLAHGGFVVGSLSISAGGVDIVDNGDGTMSGGGATGAIDYGTGSWSIDLMGLPLGNGEAITADYLYVSGAVADDGAGSGGSTGKGIQTFVVNQTGNKLEITDNNGGHYTGQLGKLATTSGIDANSPDTVVPSVGDSAIAEFSVFGVSPFGVQVMMVGTFQGVVSGSGDSSAQFLSDRRIIGTWIETGGVTGDVSGQASPIGISTTTP